MATYKVLQDIEAEDKFLGPLTLKQCIFAAIAIVSGYLSFLFLSRGVWVMVLPMIPIIIVTGFLAFPWGRDQPTETWLLAKIRFMFKPRKRIWDQTGMQEMVKITAPVRVGNFTGDNLSATEVKSRLSALASTIDSRGWAIKGADYLTATGGAVPNSDRLLDSSTLPSVSPTTLSNDAPVADMFDSPQVSQIDNKISELGNQARSQAVNKMEDSITTAATGQSPADNLWFMGGPNEDNQSRFDSSPPAITNDPGLSPMFSSPIKNLDTEDQNFLQTIKSKRQVSSHSLSNHRRVDPYNPSAQNRPNSTVTSGVSPATIVRARNNDRTVESLAREANDDEVVISLH